MGQIRDPIDCFGTGMVECLERPEALSEPPEEVAQYLQSAR